LLLCIYYIECVSRFNCHKESTVDPTGKIGDKPGTEVTAADDAAGIIGTCICVDDKFYHWYTVSCNHEKAAQGHGGGGDRKFAILNVRFRSNIYLPIQYLLLHDVRHFFLCTGCEPNYECRKGASVYDTGEDADKPGSDITAAEASAGTRGICICTDPTTFFHPVERGCRQETVTETPGSMRRGERCGLIGKASKFLIFGIIVISSSMYLFLLHSNTSSIYLFLVVQDART